MKKCVSSAVLVLFLSSAALAANPYQELTKAIQQGNAKALEKALAAHSDVINSAPKNQHPLLIIAISNRKPKMLEILLKHKADVTVADQNGYTALHYAVFYGPHDNKGNYAEMLIAAGADPLIEDKQKRSPLQYAIDRSQWNQGEKTLGALLKGLSDVDKKLSSGETALHLAARHGLTDAAKKLLDRKADPQPTNKKKQTPLDLAIVGGHTEVANLLIPLLEVTEHHALGGRLLIHWAASNNMAEATAALLSRGTKVGQPNADGETPLHIAAWNGHKEAVAVLLKAGAKVDAQDNSGQTALYGAAWNGHLPVVSLLLSAKATQVTDSGHSTALHAACWQGHAEVVAALLEAGAKLDAVDSDGATPLHKSAWRGHAAVVDRLLKAGADKTVKDRDGYTAANKAKDAGHSKLESKLK